MNDPLFLIAGATILAVIALASLALELRRDHEALKRAVNCDLWQSTLMPRAEYDRLPHMLRGAPTLDGGTINGEPHVLVFHRVFNGLPESLRT